MTRKRLVLLALLAWTAFSCALELYRSAWLLRADPWPEDRPSTWRITSRPVRRISGFAAEASKWLPAGSRVAVHTEPGPEDERFFRFLWLVYFLPGRDLRSGNEAGWVPERWIAYGTRLDDAGLRLVFESPDGAVYERKN